MKIWNKIIRYIRPYWRRVAVGLAFVMLANASRVAQPWVLRLAINGIEERVSIALLWQFAGMILGIALVAGAFRYLMRRTVIGISRHIEFDLRQSLLRHLLRLEPAFYDHSRIGDLMTRSTSDIEQVRMVIGPALMYAVNTLFGLVFGLTLMAMINPSLTLLVGAMAPLVSLTVFILGRKIHRATTASQEAFSDLSAMVQENLAGVRVVKAFLQEKPQQRKFDERSGSFFRENIRLVFLRGVMMPIIMLLLGGAVAAILLLGGNAIIQGRMRIGDLVAFLTYLMMLTWPVISIGWVVSLIQRGSASWKRLLELFEREPRLKDPQSPAKPSAIAGEVSFKGVSFTYHKANRPALENVSFELNSGETLGIVGRVGSGKSTVVSLLARLYEIDAGEIAVDGVPINGWRQHDLREKIAVVPQNPFLFSTTIRENISLGLDVSAEVVEKAVEISRLVQDLPDFPDGLETEVGERGITLSGGQKQRVAIARAVIREPEIIVLDDALSAVDADTEEKILENMRRFLKGRTAIIISHRISSVREADEIIVLDQARIAERGVHEDLMAAEGVYVEIFQHQRLARELEDAA